MMYDNEVQSDAITVPELRQTMQWNTDEFSEYRETPNEYDYANPMYYQ